MENRTIHYDHRKWKVISFCSNNGILIGPICMESVLTDFLLTNCNMQCAILDGFHLPCHPTEALNVKRNLHLLLVEAG
jgi:hypothetical protein